MEFIVYDASLDEQELGLRAVSVVNDPAIEKTFKAHQNIIKITQSDYKYLTGPILIPEQLILRHDTKLGYFYLKYSKEIIKELRDRFMQNGLLKSIDLEHSGQNIPATIVEMYMTKEATDELPEGTLMISVKPDFEITDEFLNNFKGFSIDAIVNLKKTNLTEMNIKQMMINAKLMDGTLLVIDDETGEIYYASDMRPLPTGQYTLDTNEVIDVVDGIIKKEEDNMENENPEVIVEQVKIEDFKALQTELESMKLMLANVPALINENNNKIIEKIELLQSKVTEQEKELVKIGAEPAVETETPITSASDVPMVLQILQRKNKNKK